MAGFDYKSNLDAIKNMLTDNNSATSSPDLSANLTTRVSNNNIIIASQFRQRSTWRGDRFPALFIDIISDEADFENISPPGIGSSNALRGNITQILIVGFMGKEGLHNADSVFIQDAQYLAQNIDAIIAKEYTASGTALFIKRAATNFEGEFDIDGSFVNAFSVEIEGKYLYR